MIDRILYSALLQDNLKPFLHSDTDGWRIYPNGQLGANGIPSKPTRPYAQYGEGGSNLVGVVRETRRTLTFVYDFFVYDDPGSFVRIKDIHELIAQNLTGISALVVDESWNITELIFQSYGQDGYDPVNQQSVKRATYRVIAGRPV